MIFSEEIALLSDVQPAISYEVRDSKVIVRTIYAACATQNPQKGAGCGCGCSIACGNKHNGRNCCGEDVKEEEALCDWFNFEQALSTLQTEAFRTCVIKLTSSLVEAVDAGVVVPTTKGGFRPTVDASLNDKPLNQVLALIHESQLSTSRSPAAITDLDEHSAYGHGDHLAQQDSSCGHGQQLRTRTATDSTTDSSCGHGHGDENQDGYGRGHHGDTMHVHDKVGGCGKACGCCSNNCDDFDSFASFADEIGWCTRARGRLL